jgi:ABC-type branched-subunit amino acid transport system substrate-binding protein
MRRGTFSFAATIALIAAIALVITGCGSEPRKVETIYLSVPLTGPLKERGKDMLDAANLALEKTNGDTATTELKLAAVDSDIDVPVAKAVKNPDSIAMVGGLSISGTEATAPAALKAGLLQVALAPAPTNATAAGARLGNVIWQLPSAPGQGDALAQYIASSDQKKIAFYSDGTEFADALKVGFDAGVVRAGIKPLPERSGVPVVGAGSAKGFAEADDPANPTKPSPHTLITAGMTEDAYPPAGEKFFDLFQSKYGHAPDRFAIYAYEAVGLVVDAIERAEKAGQKINRKAVLDQAFTIKNRFGPVGHYDVLPSGRTTLYIFQARGGDAPTGPASLIEAQR